MTFAERLQQLDGGAIEAQILRDHSSHMDSVLRGAPVTFEGFLALISPSALPHLEQMARLSQAVTRQRFGRTIQLYAPLYLSSHCVNCCTYCGFNRGNLIAREWLTVEQALQEAEFLRRHGFQHILLVCGEDRQNITVSYLAELIGQLHERFSSISVEIYPLTEEDYRLLAGRGLDGLTIYQETYDPGVYEAVHPSGPKQDYVWRLGTPERGGAAGLRRLNIGTLLGLHQWRLEAAMLALHTAYLIKCFWRSHIAISFPRIRPAFADYTPPAPVSDRELVQMICALRLFLPDAGLVLSTRERAELRDRLVPLGITQMSAGSSTKVGGYSGAGEDRYGQFDVEDGRSPAEVARVIADLGYDPVWKDWDRAFTG